MKPRTLRYLRPLVGCLLVLALGCLPASAQPAGRPYPVGRLAFVSAGKLYVELAGSAVPVAGHGSVLSPAFSFDGQWLAFLRQTPASASQLWIARGDGSRPRIAVSDVSYFAWSPTADVIATWALAGYRAPRVLLVTPIGRPRPAPTTLGATFVWSPDGRTLAVTGTPPQHSAQIDLIRGNHVRSIRLSYLGPNSRVILAGWWPGNRGILYWLDYTGCVSCIADGTPLVEYDLASGKARRLGVTLPYGDWIAPHGNRLLFVEGGIRSAFFGKHVVLCIAGGGCKRLPGVPGSDITEDPAWSPVSDQFALVVAPAWKTEGWDNRKEYRRWLDGHVLRTAQVLPSVAIAWDAIKPEPADVSAPQWTRDGRGLLFVKNGALWGYVHYGATGPQPLAQLIPKNTFPDHSSVYQLWYYGHIDWGELYAAY